jgi:TRAP-type C4-dicarboxylate transport system permease small subunit
VIEQTEKEVPGPKVLKKVEGALVALSAICILGICAMITVAITTRAVFGWSVPDSVIIVRELMITCVILPLAYVTAERAHIMVEVFTNHMPDRIQPWLDFLSSVIGFLVLLPICYGGYLELMGVIEDEAYFFGDLELPEWPGRLAFFVGYVTFVLRLATLVVSDGLTAFRKLGDSAPAPSAEN